MRLARLEPVFLGATVSMVALASVAAVALWLMWYDDIVEAILRLPSLTSP